MCQVFGKELSKLFSFANKDTDQSITPGALLQAKHFSHRALEVSMRHSKM